MKESKEMSDRRFLLIFGLVSFALVFTILIFTGLLDNHGKSSTAESGLDSNLTVGGLTTATCLWKGWGVLENNVGPINFRNQPILDFYATFRNGDRYSRIEMTKWWVHVPADALVVMTNHKSDGFILEIKNGTMDEMLNRMYVSDVVLRVPPGIEEAWTKKIAYIADDEDGTEND